MSPLMVLQLIFITLKLCHVINWSWWGVMGPTLGLVIYFFVIAVLKSVKGQL